MYINVYNSGFPYNSFGIRGMTDVDILDYRKYDLNSPRPWTWDTLMERV